MPVCKVKSENKILDEDLNRFISSFPFISRIKGKSFLVTGASGLIGSLLVKCLLRLNDHFNAEISITTMARDRDKLERMIGSQLKNVILQDIAQPLDVHQKVDYVFHCAAVTDSKKMTQCPAEVLMSMILGTKNLLDFSKEHQIEGMVYLSSIETYGTFEEECLIRENEAGYIDPLNIRSCYPLGKKSSECLCRSYFEEYGVPVKIARLTQTFGAGVSVYDNRVFAQFAKSAMNGEAIELHTKGDSSKPYCYTMDALQALFYILLKGHPGDAYNVANPASYISILEMANMVAERFSGGLSKVKIDLREDMGYAPSTKSRLDVSKLMELGWQPNYSLEEMFARYMAYMKEENERTDY